MLRGAAPLLLAVVTSAACGGKKVATTPPDPGPVLDASGAELDIAESYDLSTSEALSEHEAEARAAMAWLITAFPAARPKQWVKARDLALDWIEANEALGVKVDDAVLQAPLMDRRWKFSMYARGVYLAGKTLYILEHPDAAGTMEAEVAAVEALFRFEEVTAQVDPHGSSPKLKKYRRKNKKGKLEDFLAKKMAKGK